LGLYQNRQIAFLPFNLFLKSLHGKLKGSKFTFII